MKPYFGFHVLFTVTLAGFLCTEMTILLGIRSERFELASILAHLSKPHRLETTVANCDRLSRPCLLQTLSPSAVTRLVTTEKHWLRAFVVIATSNGG